MKVEVDMESNSMVIELTMEEAGRCATATDMGLSYLEETNPSKPILGALYEAFGLRPPTTVEREIVL